MATEKINLTAPEEPVGNIAEDTQTTTVTTEQMATDHTDSNVEEVEVQMNEIFADEDVELAANEAGLEIGEETEEEASAPTSTDNLTGLNEEALVTLFAQNLEEKPIQTLRPVVEAIKIAFYKQHRAKVEAERKAFLENGGNEEEFTPSADPFEVRFKELFATYRNERDKHIATIEANKEENYKTKLHIIEELKELINSDETMNTTFARFRELQQRWKETGLVPQQHVKDLWETYNLHVENFYNFIRINKNFVTSTSRRTTRLSSASVSRPRSVFLTTTLSRPSANSRNSTTSGVRQVL